MSVHTNNHSDHGNDSRRDVKGSVKIIALYFGTIQKLLKEKNQSITQQDDEKFQATKVAFQIEEYAWIISHTLDHVEVVEISVSPSNPFNVINLNCRVITTTSALLSIATGGSPMMAFLQGSFKIIGDKQILRHYAPILKEAAIILQRDLRRSSAQLDKISNSGTEMLSSLYSVSVIDISYHSPTNPSSFHTVSELTSVYSDVTSVNGGDHSSSVAYYVIEVCDLNLNYAWRLRQRYSQFVKLHEGLTLQKYSLPSLPDRIALFRSQASLVESRKVSLQSYLRELLTRIDSNNMFMRVFLKLSRDVAAKYNDNNNECDDDDDNRSDEDEDDENRFKLQKKSTFNQQNASRNKIENTTNTSRSAHSFTNTNTATVASTTATIKNKTPTTVDTVPKLYDIWMHAYSQPITWHKALTNHTVHILQELNRTRKMLSLVSKSTSTAIDSTSTINSNNNSNNGRSTLLMRVQSSIVSFIVLSMVVLVCTYKHTENVSSNIVATIAFDHTRISVVGILEYIYLFLRFYMTTQLIPLTFSLVLFALLASPTTRYTFIYRILMLILIQSVFEVGHDQLHPFQSNKQMNIFESDEIIKSTHVGIETFYFVISIVFKYLIKNMISVFKSYFSYLYSFLSVLFNGVAIMKFSVLFYSNIISSFIFIGSIFIMSISSLRRVISIYALGFGLIFLYLGLKVICVLFRLSASRQDMLYEYIESIIAPYITTQIRQLRSVFIKFAQYAGARSDVISDQWAAVLSELQDSCPSSDPLYVIQTIENNLNDTFVLLPSTDDTEIKSSTNLDTTNTTNDNVDNKKHTRISIKDVFEEFSVESIASASIGQVHHAVLSTKTLKRLAFKVTLKAPTSINSSTDQSGSPTLADAFEVQRSSLQDSFTHPLFSAHQHSLASNYTTKSNSISTHASYGNLSGDDDDEKIAVVVKVQHEHIRATMLADMNVIKILTRVASWLDKRWVVRI